ncbi:type II toxin-antitoxin system VapC family toxin [Ottowia testudinis]|uniref:Type II toxin-antitoxin system VapC family toxin n=1 Tax=Ottowia testudinis TaxID=2816950 RepID=A0A975CE08_9BURK|nr:type II toxin-antitoxin system VapC family toxin [Ottowia testudinis]QTD43794.1 type II toxin-antitoxin system VapC family toxin [Ottowia testudinis]
MGALSTLVQRLAGQSVYFDTNPIIYFLNQTPGYFDICVELFQAVEDGRFNAYSGDLCLTELLVKPLRDNDPIQVRHIKGLFDDGFVQLLSHDRAVLELAAQIRATQNLRMIDAVHAATAIHHRCSVIITGDKGIAKRLKGIEVVDLNEFLPADA